MAWEKTTYLTIIFFPFHSKDIWKYICTVVFPWMQVVGVKYFVSLYLSNLSSYVKYYYCFHCFSKFHRKLYKKAEVGNRFSSAAKRGSQAPSIQKNFTTWFELPLQLSWCFQDNKWFHGGRFRSFSGGSTLKWLMGCCNYLFFDIPKFKNRQIHIANQVVELPLLNQFEFDVTS